MRAVLTRVSSASVTVDGRVIGAIGKGFLVLLGVHVSDTEADADYIADRICGLRVFEDAQGKMNVSPADAGGVTRGRTLKRWQNCRRGAITWSGMKPTATRPRRFLKGSP